VCCRSAEAESLIVAVKPQNIVDDWGIRGAAGDELNLGYRIDQ
jgi:hypothetical protein